MKAKFELEAIHTPVIRLEPEYGSESILMAAFIRYESNVFCISVERYENGHIKSVTLRASDAS